MGTKEKRFMKEIGLFYMVSTKMKKITLFYKIVYHGIML